MAEIDMPAFPVAGPERERFFHHIEHLEGWEYRSTSSTDPDWVPVPPAGFHLNEDKGVGYDEAAAGWVKVAPGVLRKPGGLLVAYWRRKK